MEWNWKLQKVGTHEGKFYRKNVFDIIDVFDENFSTPDLNALLK